MPKGSKGMESVDTATFKLLFTASWSISQACGMSVPEGKETTRNGGSSHFIDRDDPYLETSPHPYSAAQPVREPLKFRSTPQRSPRCLHAFSSGESNADKISIQQIFVEQIYCKAL